MVRASLSIPLVFECGSAFGMHFCWHENLNTRAGMTVCCFYIVVMNVTLTGVRTCLWVQGLRTESSWQLLTAVLLLVCWRVENVKSLEKVLQVRGSV